MKRVSPIASPLLAVLIAFLTGCREAKVTAYRAAKDAEPSLPATPAGHPSPDNAAAPNAPVSSPGGGMSGPAVSTASGQALTWTAPAEWQIKPATPMRKGSYAVNAPNGETADLSITAFPGAVGGELANLNRWRGQVSLPPVDESALDTSVTRLSANGLTFTVVDCVSTDATPRRILGAMTPYDGAMWFFKLTGPDVAVSSAKPAFLDFLKTVKTAPTATP